MKDKTETSSTTCAQPSSSAFERPQISGLNPNSTQDDDYGGLTAPHSTPSNADRRQRTNSEENRKPADCPQMTGWKHPDHLSPHSLLPARFAFACVAAATLLLMILPPVSSDYSGLTQPNRNSGHFSISQLCAGKSQIPVSRIVDGAVLSSDADVDVNCTITFRTKLATQQLVVRFEELKLGCDDHLKMFDGDIDYGRPSIKDFSCRDNLASVEGIKTTGTFLTLKFSSDSRSKVGDGFRMVITAVSSWANCPPDYGLCRNGLCISRSLFCDQVNHCVDNSDEANCSSLGPNGSQFPSDLALSLLVVLVIVIFSCVIIFIATIYCRRESHYAQYQHQIQRAIGVPLQTSSSLMFAANQPQYHYFQPATPYVTPQHQQAMARTLPHGYSTLPINIARQQQQHHLHQQQQQQNHQQHQTPILTKGNEYLVMAGLPGPQNSAAMQMAPTMQTNLYLPTSQSIIPGAIRYPLSPSRR